MDRDKELSILSSFLLKKVEAKGWSKKEFAEHTELSTSYAYELLSDKREAIPSEEILNKVSLALGLIEMESKYLLALGECERKIDKVIYSSDGIDVPEPPGEDADPSEPEPDDPVPLVHPDPVEPDDPIQPPAPVSGGDVEVSWGHKKVIVALIVGLAGGLMLGCCAASTVVPVIMSGMGF